MRVFLTFISCLMASVAQAEPLPIDLQPTGSWKVDYADRTCLLSRSFFAEGRNYQLEVVFEPVTHLSWLRFGSTEKMGKRDDGDSIVAVDGRALAVPIHFNIFPSSAGGTVREFMFEEFRQEVGIATRSLRLRLGKYGDFNFNLGGFQQAITAAKACVDDLHRSLKIEPSILDAIASPPQGSAFSFVQFPRGSGGLNLIILYWVNPEGRVDECRLLASTGHPKFDLSACKDLEEKGRYAPARDRSGAPVRAPVYEYIRLRTETSISTSPL